MEVLSKQLKWQELTIYCSNFLGSIKEEFKEFEMLTLNFTLRLEMIKIVSLLETEKADEAEKAILGFETNTLPKFSSVPGIV